jgi:glycosyltransferase involved in cell wall biosynthesis
VGYIGAFEYFIDWRTIIDAASRMPEIIFLLVGSGREWSAARDYAASLKCTNVEFTGGVPHADVFRYIRAMDICFNLFHSLPVSHRACPIKLFEYMSMGKPVISTRLDELQHIDPGLLYYARNADEVVARIREIYGARAEADERGRQGRQLVETTYQWSAIAESFERLLVQSQRVPGTAC